MPGQTIMWQEIGIGVAEAGATGATGAFPRDRGPWRSGESYEWSADYRDKVIHPFNGVYYNFLVRTQGSTVTDAPTSANGDDNWEAMNKLVNIATDTLFLTEPMSQGLCLVVV